MAKEIHINFTVRWIEPVLTAWLWEDK